MFRIITIEREYGSGAAGIARKLADRLGWSLWDERLTQEIARLSHCRQSDVKIREERPDPLYYRLFKSFALGSWEGSTNASAVEMLDADSIVRVSEKAVLEAADAGNCVIVGRGSQHFLRDRSDTLRFFLYAPGKDKVRRLMGEGKTESEAEALVETVDRDRSAFIKKYFHVKWPNRSLYHAMFNTAAGDEMIIQAIMGFQHTTSGEAASPAHNVPRPEHR